MPLSCAAPSARADVTLVAPQSVWKYHAAPAAPNADAILAKVVEVVAAPAGGHQAPQALGILARKRQGDIAFHRMPCDCSQPCSSVCARWPLSKNAL